MNDAKILNSRIFILVFSFSLLVGPAFFCSSCGKDPEADRLALMKRAEGYWQLKKKGDYVEIYRHFLDPPSKEKLELAAYIKTTGMLQFPDFEITDANIKGDRGEVEIRFKMKWEAPIFEDTELKWHKGKETYIKVDGTWYKKYEKPTLIREGRNDPLAPPKKTGRKLGDPR